MACPWAPHGVPLQLLMVRRTVSAHIFLPSAFRLLPSAYRPPSTVYRMPLSTIPPASPGSVPPAIFPAGRSSRGWPWRPFAVGRSGLRARRATGGFRPFRASWPGARPLPCYRKSSSGSAAPCNPPFSPARDETGIAGCPPGNSACRERWPARGISRRGRSPPRCAPSGGATP